MPDGLKTGLDPVTDQVQLVASEVTQEKARSLWTDAWRDLRRNPVFVVSALLIVLLVVIAFAPGLFTSVDPNHADLAKHYLGKPKYSDVFQEDWFGYDVQGRSIYSRVLYGAQASII